MFFMDLQRSGDFFSDSQLKINLELILLLLLIFLGLGFLYFSGTSSNPRGAVTDSDASDQKENLPPPAKETGRFGLLYSRRSNAYSDGYEYDSVFLGVFLYDPRHLVPKEMFKFPNDQAARVVRVASFSGKRVLRSDENFYYTLQRPSGGLTFDLTRFDLDGNYQKILTFSDSISLLGHMLGISPSGTKIAYCRYSSSDSETSVGNWLSVKEIESGRELFKMSNDLYGLPMCNSFGENWAAFSEDENLIYYSRAVYSPDYGDLPGREGETVEQPDLEEHAVRDIYMLDLRTGKEEVLKGVMPLFRSQLGKGGNTDYQSYSLLYDKSRLLIKRLPERDFDYLEEEEFKTLPAVAEIEVPGKRFAEAMVTADGSGVLYNLETPGRTVAENRYQLGYFNFEPQEKTWLGINSPLKPHIIEAVSKDIFFFESGNVLYEWNKGETKVIDREFYFTPVALIDFKE